MLFVTLAWRNVRRNRRRSLLTLSAIALSVAALFFAWAFFDGQNVQIVENMTGYNTGHAQIQRRGYQKDPSLDLAFRLVEGAAVLKAASSAASAPRLSGNALLSSESNSRGVLVMGIDPRAETLVTLLHTKITSGRFFTEEDRGGVVLGRRLAKVMGVDVGGEVAVITEGMRGSMGAQRFRVLGMLNTGNEIVDAQQILITLDDAFALFDSDGEVTGIALRFDSLAAVEGGVAALRVAAGTGLDVLGWRELSPEVAQEVDFHEAMVSVVMLLLFVIVAAGVANAMLVTIVERQREFGTMAAMGTSPWQIFRGIVYEGSLIALIGLAIGLVVGFSLVAWLGATGIDLGGSAARGTEVLQQDLTTRAYPAIKAERGLVISLAMLGFVWMATVYPAWRAARLSPIAALKGRGVTGSRHAGVWSGRFTSWRYVNAALAMRNLLRYPLRSSLTLCAIALSLGAYVFVGAFLRGYQSQVVENATGLVTGDLQIQHADFRAEMKPTLAFVAAPDWLSGIRNLPQVQAASVRVQSIAAVTSAVRTDLVELVGIDPQNESRVTHVHRAIRLGRGLQGGRDIVVGRKLAERLDVRVGERIVATLQSAAGQLAAEAFLVVGIFETSDSELDRNVVYAVLPRVQSLLGLGERVTSVAIRLSSRDHLSESLPALRARLHNGDLRVLSWEELLPEIVQMNELIGHVLVLIAGTVFLVVALVVMNTVLMSVLERAREFGTLLAIGAGPAAVARLVAVESALLALAGIAAALVFGGGAAWRFSSSGLRLEAAGGSGVAGVTDIVYPAVSGSLLLGSSLAVFVMVMGAAIYPALQIARLDPVQAIRRT